eukprot:SAG31_NODE_1828_length_7159_cov_58.418980_1_plen_23_part_10
MEPISTLENLIDAAKLGFSWFHH